MQAMIAKVTGCFGGIVFLLLASSCAEQASEPLTSQREGVAVADDGVEISYRLMGPADAPTLWVGYPWSEGMNDLLSEISGARVVQDHSAMLSRLTEKYRVLYVDYPRGIGGTTGPLPDDLLPETAAKDYEVVADAAGIDRFVALGYSWGAALGVQVALHSKRCAGLAIGGWPVLGAPFEEIIPQSAANAAALPPGRGRDTFVSNVNFYEASLAGWDDQESMEALQRDRAGLLYLYVGSEDVGVPAQGLNLPIAERIVEHRKPLEDAGWRVAVFAGFDHMNLPEDVWLDGVLAFLEGKSW